MVGSGDQTYALIDSRSAECNVSTLLTELLLQPLTLPEPKASTPAPAWCCCSIHCFGDGLTELATHPHLLCFLCSLWLVSQGPSRNGDEMIAIFGYVCCVGDSWGEVSDCLVSPSRPHRCCLSTVAEMLVLVPSSGFRSQAVSQKLTLAVWSSVLFLPGGPTWSLLQLHWAS